MSYKCFMLTWWQHAGLLWTGLSTLHYTATLRPFAPPPTSGIKGRIFILSESGIAPATTDPKWMKPASLIQYVLRCIYTETFLVKKHIWYSGHFQGDWLRHSNSQVRVPRSLRAPVTISTANRSVPQTPVGANCVAFFVHWPQKKKESQQFVKCHSLCVCSSAGQLSS